MRYTQYSKYKDSSIEWLGEIPEGWERKRLKHITSINDEALGENTDQDYELLYVDISSVDSINGIINKEPMTFDKAPSRARRKVKEGDVIVSTVRTYLRAIAPILNAESNLIVSTGFAVIRPKKKLTSSFASYVLRSTYFVDNIVSRSVGVSYPAINASEIGTLSIALPLFNEQQSIASFLDRETQKIDTLISKKESQIELLQEKRSALISHAVTKGLEPDVNMKDSGIEWLGEIPEGWGTLECKFGYSIQLGKMLQNGPQTIDDEKVPYLKALNVQWESVDTYDLPEMWASSTDFEKYSVIGGDLLVCEGGEVGRSGILLNPPVKCIIQNALHRVRPIKGNSSKYLMYLLEVSSYQGWFDILCNKATIAHFTGDKFGCFLIALPAPEEQMSIASFLDQETQKIDTLIDKIKLSIDKLREYRTAMISAAVTGKIDVRGIS